MPSADFCTAVRDPYGSLSPYRTRCRSPGVSLTAFTAHLPNLQPGLIVDTGLRGSGPARPTQTASYSVPVRQVAALLPRFLQTAPRGHRPCASLALCLHQTWAEDLHLRAVKHARHTRRRSARSSTSSRTAIRSCAGRFATRSPTAAARSCGSTPANRTCRTSRPTPRCRTRWWRARSHCWWWGRLPAAEPGPGSYLVEELKAHDSQRGLAHRIC